MFRSHNKAANEFKPLADEGHMLLSCLRSLQKSLISLLIGWKNFNANAMPGEFSFGFVSTFMLQYSSIVTTYNFIISLQQDNLMGNNLRREIKNKKVISYLNCEFLVCLMIC